MIKFWDVENVRCRHTASRGRRFLTAFLLALFVYGSLPAFARDLYEQPPFTSAELNQLIDILPRFRSWVHEHKESVHPVVTNGKPDFVYSPATAAYLEAAGWKPERFFCVMGRSAAALALIEQGKELADTPPPDMPKVAPSELEQVRTSLTSLLNALMRS